MYPHDPVVDTPNVEQCGDVVQNCKFEMVHFEDTRSESSSRVINYNCPEYGDELAPACSC